MISEIPEDDGFHDHDNGGVSLVSCYQPLDREHGEIRILCLEDSSNEDSATLKFHFETVRLDDDESLPVFEAISYTWGKSSERAQIEVNSQSLSIPINTEKALQCIARQHGHHRVFIDAVCINQNDIAERSHQVTLMGQVYSKASEGLIWLGDAPSGPTPGLAVLNEIMPHYESIMNLEIDEKFKDRRIQELGRRFPLSSLYQIYAAEWFGRTWVIQELLLSRKATCFQGAHSAPWSYVFSLAGWIRKLQVTPYVERSLITPAIMRGINGTNILQFVSQETTSLEEVFASAISFDCSIAQDKLYSLLGLASHDKWDFRALTHVVPDYEESIVSTFVKATRACIEQSKSLRFLHWAGRGFELHRTPMSTESFPSWVLRLDTWKNVRPPLHESSSTADGKHMPAVLHPMKDAHILPVTGLLVSEIEQCAPAWQPRPVSDPEGERVAFRGMICDCMWLFDHLYRVFEWASNSLPGIGPRELALQFFEAWMATSNFTDYVFEDKRDRFRKLLFDVMESESRKRGFSEVQLHEDCQVEPFSVEAECRASLENAHLEQSMTQMVASFLRPGMNMPAVNFNPPNQVKHPFIVEFCNALRKTAPLFAFYKTANDQLGIGIGPKEVQEGDCVCIIFGEGLPAILRPETDGWKWVGFVYFASLADGSYVRDLKERGTLERETCIFDLH